MNWQYRVAASYPLLSGAIFLGLGLLTLIRPEVLEYYSIGVDNAPARTAIRAMIGGGEIGLGMLILGGRQVGFSISQRSMLAATIFVCVGLTRLGSAWLDNQLNLESQALREASIELILGVLGVWTVTRKSKTCA